MELDLWLTIGIIGMVLILWAFLMAQAGKWKNEDLIYDFINFLGSLMLLIYAFAGNAWPFVVLNTIWGGYSLRDVFADLKRNKKRSKK